MSHHEDRLDLSSVEVELKIRGHKGKLGAFLRWFHQEDECRIDADGDLIKQLYARYIVEFFILMEEQRKDVIDLTETNAKG